MVMIPQWIQREFEARSLGEGDLRARVEYLSKRLSSNLGETLRKRLIFRKKEKPLEVGPFYALSEIPDFALPAIYKGLCRTCSEAL